LVIITAQVTRNRKLHHNIIVRKLQIKRYNSPIEGTHCVRDRSLQLLPATLILVNYHEIGKAQELYYENENFTVKMKNFNMKSGTLNMEF
jgi:hypothetical protein